jgi:hypothetical protein
MPSIDEEFSTMQELKQSLEAVQESFVEQFDTSLIFDDLEKIIQRCAKESSINQETVDSLLTNLLDEYSEMVVITKEEV